MAVDTGAAGVFELKSATLAAVALHLRSADLGALADEMARRFGESPGVFEHDPVVIDLGALAAEDAAIDFAGLVALLTRHSLVPVAVRRGSAAQHAAARDAGLGDVAADAPARQPTPRPMAEGVPEAVATGAPAAADAREDEAPAEMAQGAADAPAEPPVTSPAPAAAPTLIVDRPLRSGQQVYARGGDLVVLAIVSDGAEVIADGSIHVYAPLRGRAIAGAKGNTAARIFSTSMQPQLVSIAGTYRTTETPLPSEVVGRPAQVRLDGERLVVEPLDS